jgi:hypothetical protein
MWIWNENSGRVGSWGTFPGSQHFGGRGVCWSSGMGIKKSDKHQLFTQTYINQTTSWLVHSWSTFCAKISHVQTRTHKTHHGPDLGEATTFPLIVYSVPLHEAHIQMAFCLGTPRDSLEIPKIRTSTTLGPHNFVCRSPIEMISKEKL